MKVFKIAIKDLGETARDGWRTSPFNTALKHELNKHVGVVCERMAEYKSDEEYDFIIEVDNKPYQWADFVITSPYDVEGTLENNLKHKLELAYGSILKDIRLRRLYIDGAKNKHIRLSLPHKDEFDKFKPYAVEIGRYVGNTLGNELGFTRRRK